MRSIQQLYQKITLGEAEPIEIDQFLDLLAIPENEGVAKELLNDYFLHIENQRNTEKIPTERLNMLAERIQMLQEGGQTNLVRTSLRRIHFLQKAWLRIAAAILIICGVSVYLYWQNEGAPKKSPHSEIASQDIPPGKNGAILTLADGSIVPLDSLENGVVANQNGANVILKDGQLVYGVANNHSETTAYNTVTTPKGRQFNIQLPDGTNAWLNAESSIQYPTRFDKERTVNITGEVYFEVAKNKTMPFFVKIKDQAQIEVLGTSFNVNAYENEASINTTLIEGSVKVSSFASTINAKDLTTTKSTNSIILHPGEQAQVAEKITLIKDANIEKEMAWKNGLFHFQGKNLEEVMRQLVRWYDIEVVYENGIPDIRFGGELSRDISLAGLMKVLSVSKVHYRMEGRKLIILP